MVEEHNKIACGQYHSCFIGMPDNQKDGKVTQIQMQRLYVWGQNDEGQLFDVITSETKSYKKKLERPQEVRLMFGQREYEAVSVTSGPSYNVIIGELNLEYEKEQQMQNRKKSKQKWHFKMPLIMPDDKNFENYPASTKITVEKIRRMLKQILIKKGTLANLFNDHEDATNKKTDQDVNIEGRKRDGGYSQFYQEDRSASAFKPQQKHDMKGNAHQEDPTQIYIERQEFMDQFSERGLCTLDEIQVVSEVLFSSSAEISLHQLEDFALGFQQQATKLFMYGKCDAKLFSFNKKLPIVNPKAKNRVSDAFDFDKGTSSESDGDFDAAAAKMSIITRPTIITFPRFTPKVVQVSCGIGHILALTSQQDMFSWGNGEYGALGFGSIQSVSTPTPLFILQNDTKLKIVKVECGSLHSMCITNKRKIFTWGCGKQGRLGHGNEEDVLNPTEIQLLSNMRVIQVSAGESHCAAITQTKKVYVWGNGSYGRLGTGFEATETSPVLVEDLSDKKIIKVNCGTFHTFVLSEDGLLYAFGQNKYGKLGLNVRIENTMFKSTYVEIFAYSLNIGETKQTITLDSNATFKEVKAGYNHSMAVTKQGKVYTWGYSGYGVLGRLGIENIPVQVGTGFKDGNNNYRVKLPKNQPFIPLEELGQSQKQQSNVQYSTKIQQVQCVSLGTVVLTDRGDVYYTGDSRYGQNTIVDEKGGADFGNKNNEAQLFKLIMIGQVENNIKVRMIACGGDHIFAVTRDDMVYGWGRNDSAELGLGMQQDYINQPTIVPCFREIAVLKIVCGPNYSAAITTSHKLMVAGSMEHGKLGLGPNQRSGFAQDFTLVTRLKSVKDVACGPTHMLAIVSTNTSSGCGVFAWGNNSMGQLGTDNTESSYSPKEIALKKSERFEKVCAGLDFSLGLSRTSKKVYMWGNIKYYGANTNTTQVSHKAPIQIKDLESHKIKNIFCSQTYVYVITENDEIKHWGEWFYERAQEAFRAAEVIPDQDEEEFQGKKNEDGESNESEEQDQSSENSEEDSDEDFSYETSEDGDKDNDENKKEEKKRKKNDNTKNFHPISVFQAENANSKTDGKKEKLKLVEMAFGTNHGSAIGDDGLLYTWGHNQTQQLGITLEEYGANILANATRHQLASRVHSSSINIMLKANWKKMEEENPSGQVPSGTNPMSNHKDEDDEDSATPRTLSYQQNRTQNLNQDQQVEEQDRAPPRGDQQIGKEFSQSQAVSAQDKKTATNPSVLAKASQGKGVHWPDQKREDTGAITPTKDASLMQSEAVNLNQIVLTEKGPGNAVTQSKPQVTPGTNRPKQKINEFQAPRPAQNVRIFEITEMRMEQKHERLQQILKGEESKETNEQSLFDKDKSINDSFYSLLKLLAQLPDLERARKTLKLQIKNAFLQRIFEKPFNVPPAVDFNALKFKTYKEKQTRKKFKPRLQQALLILQSHPCYFVEMYRSKKVSNEKMLSYLENLLPQQCYTNQQLMPGHVKLDAGIMVSREQERINLLLISFIKQIVESELSGYKTLEKVDFNKEDSLIGILFYRILESQEKNVDTVCSMLAHLMNNFITGLQENQDFEAQKQTTDATKRAAQEKGKSQQKAVSREHTPANTQMYAVQLNDLVENILSNKILSASINNFEIKKVWRDQNDPNLPSLRFSSEIHFLIDIIMAELKKKESRASSKKNSLEELIAKKIMGLIFYRMIKKISSSIDTLKLYLYPYLRETKKQILIEEGMTRQGDTYLELVDVMSCFFSDKKYQTEKNEAHFGELRQHIENLQATKLVEIFDQMKTKNQMQTKLLPFKHFENVLFHSLSPYDFQLILNRDTMVQMFDDLKNNADEIALLHPPKNDQLFQCFIDSAEKDGIQYKDYIDSLKTYPTKFKISIRSRQFVNNAKPKIQKCKECFTVLSDDFVKLESQPIIDQYEPEDKESLVSVYCDVLRNLPFDLDKNKSILHQIEESKKGSKQAQLDKINEFDTSLKREVTNNKDSHPDAKNPQKIAQLYEELKFSKISEQFENKLFEGQEDKQDIQKKLEGIAQVTIFDNILRDAQKKINERLIHKQISSVLAKRIGEELMVYLIQSINEIKETELRMLGIALLNTQLGMGNTELKKLAKNSDQVSQMKEILSAQKSQKFSKVLYRVLPDKQKMNLRAIVQKTAKELIKSQTLTDIKIESLKPMINNCTLLIMEDDSRNVLIKLLYQQKQISCLCFSSKPMENLLLQFQLDQTEIVDIRKHVKAYQMFKTHVNLAFDSDNVALQKQVIQFAQKMTNQGQSSSETKGKGKKKTQKKGAETRETALQMLSIFNRRTFKDCLEFDLTKLMALVNDMVRTRYAYVFNSERTPNEMVSELQ